MVLEGTSLVVGSEVSGHMCSGHRMLGGYQERVGACTGEESETLSGYPKCWEIVGIPVEGREIEDKQQERERGLVPGNQEDMYSSWAGAHHILQMVSGSWL